jgi:hypothetical protein
MPSPGPEGVERHHRSMHINLKSLLEVADDTEDDPALQEDDDNEKPFPGGVEAS